MAAPGSSPYTPQGGPAATTPPRYTTYTEYLGDVLKVDPEYEICHHLQGELLSNNRQMLPRGTLGFLRVAADGKLVHSSKHSMFNPLVDFKRTLTTFDKSIEYQIVTLELTMPYPPPAVMDILGLELDIGPTAWKNLCDPDQKSIPWIRGGNFVRVGADTVMILESSPKARPKTGTYYILILYWLMLTCIKSSYPLPFFGKKIRKFGVPECA
jgi:hypothetical protein